MPTFVGLLSACRLCVGSVQTQDESEEEVVPGREDDLKLSDVPEDMREAVQGPASHRRLVHSS